MGLVFSSPPEEEDAKAQQQQRQANPLRSRGLFDDDAAGSNNGDDNESGLLSGIIGSAAAAAAAAAASPSAAAAAGPPPSTTEGAFPLGAPWPQNASRAPLHPPTSSSTPTDQPVALVHDALTMDAHLREGHPEHPDRTRALARALAEKGLLQRCHRLRQRPATDAELAAVHGSGHVRRVETLFAEAMEAVEAAAAREAAAAAAAKTDNAHAATDADANATPLPPPAPLAHLTDGAGRPLRDADDKPARMCPRGFKLVLLGGDIFVGPGTAVAARMAAGCAAEAAAAIARWEPDSSPSSTTNLTSVPRAFAAVRPPGHHASSDRAGGFCFYNAAAVAARVALSCPGSRVKRVLIFDPDVHHGNGTQDVFYNDPRVLTVSLHRRDGRFFPDGSGGAFEVGAAAVATAATTTTSAAGLNVNVPWRSRGVGDADVLAAMELIVEPIARAFAPDLIVVAAGFDAARGDPLGGCLCSAPLHGALVERLLRRVPSARGRMLAVLEGGYSPRVVAACASEVVAAMLETPATEKRPPLQKPQKQQQQPPIERERALPAAPMLKSTPSALCEVYCAQHPFWGAALDEAAAASSSSSAAAIPASSSASATPPPPPTPAAEAASWPTDILSSSTIFALPRELPPGTPPPLDAPPPGLAAFRQRVAELAAEYQLKALSLGGGGTGGSSNNTSAALRGLEALDPAVLASPRAVRKTTAAQRLREAGGGSDPPSPRAGGGGSGGSSPLARGGRGEAGSLLAFGATPRVRGHPKAPPRGEGRGGAGGGGGGAGQRSRAGERGGGGGSTARMELF
jgi:histone deacetylase 6